MFDKVQVPTKNSILKNAHPKTAANFIDQKFIVINGSKLTLSGRC